MDSTEIRMENLGDTLKDNECSESKKFLNSVDFYKLKQMWDASAPFSHISIDDFLKSNIAEAISGEFPDFKSEDWRVYDNQIEVKKLQNHWDKFGLGTYKLMQFLNSRWFISQLEILTGCSLFPDYGLNGGGLHSHKRGGKLNVHLDYSIHPKLKLERRVNLLIYLTPNWEDKWGGFLGLWGSEDGGKAPGDLVKTIAPTFNRAVLFDTTQNSWHGLPDEIMCPEGVTRNSLAVYYLCEPRDQADDRGKALFAPYKDQVDDPDVLSLIKRRSDVNLAAGAYGDKK